MWCKIAIVMTMSTSVGNGFENIYHIYQPTGRAWYNTKTINFVVTPQDVGDPNSLIQYFSLCLRRAVASFKLLVLLYFYACFVCFVVFNATFNYISVISWRSVFLFWVEETGGPGENYRLLASRWQTFSHNVVHLALISISCDSHWLHR
jgi:hypothetical protein